MQIPLPRRYRVVAALRVGTQKFGEENQVKKGWGKYIKLDSTIYTPVLKLKNTTFRGHRPEFCLFVTPLVAVVQ